METVSQWTNIIARCSAAVSANELAGSDHVTCFLCGLRHVTLELCFPFRGYITRVRSELRRVLVEFRGSRMIEKETARRLLSDLKC
jgi:hypothetical protein